MAEEFTIKSDAIEDKINQLLPSQGGFGAGLDFSASTMVIPVVDLTEAAEGSALRADLQRSLSLTSITDFNVVKTTTTVLNTTGYYKFDIIVHGTAVSAGNSTATINITDGTTTKALRVYVIEDQSSTTPQPNIVDTFDVLVKAGESIEVISTSTNITVKGLFRQIADLSKNLVNP